MSGILTTKLIRCKASLLHSIKESEKEFEFNWFYSKDKGEDEIEVWYIDEYSLTDKQLCRLLGLDFDQVISVESKGSV